ncbi:MAG TPA: histidine kinase [Opitutaceae bacterium]|nr:histidine kinase [Opitutaceae bacterium]
MKGNGASPDAKESHGWLVAYWFFQVLFWGGYVAAGLALVLPQTGPQPAILVGYGLFFFYSIGLSHGLRRVIRRREWLMLSPGPAALRLFGAALGLGVILTLLVIAVQSLWTRSSPLSARRDILISTWISITAATFIWTAGYTAVASLLRSRRARQNALALEFAMREARLQALEAQLAPHFLFNCLNSLRGMIMEDPARAQDMVTRLANILRHNLLRDAKPTETLAEQIEFTADYLTLESIRFDERLQRRFSIAAETRSCVIPAMLLQTLVENALKHGIAHLTGAGEIAITTRFEGKSLVVMVENTGSLAQSATGSTRVGLKNLRERLRVLYGLGAELELAETGAGTVRAIARIPDPAASPPGR